MSYRITKYVNNDYQIVLFCHDASVVVRSTTVPASSAYNAISDTEVGFEVTIKNILSEPDTNVAFTKHDTGNGLLYIKHEVETPYDMVAFNYWFEAPINIATLDIQVPTDVYESPEVEGSIYSVLIPENGVTGAEVFGSTTTDYVLAGQYTD